MSSAVLPKSFRGWPATKLVKDPSSGHTGVDIHDVYLTPEGAKGSLRWTAILSLLFAGDLLLMATGPVAQDFWVMVAIVFPLFIMFTSRFIRWLYTKHVRIRVYRDRILVSGWSGEDEYPTNMDIEFTLQKHEKTMEEEASRIANPDAKYYNNSAEAVMLHAKQPIVLATVYPRSKAQKLVSRVAGALEGLAMNSFEPRTR